MGAGALAKAEVACLKSLKRVLPKWLPQRCLRCLGPMVGASELAFRLLTRTLGSADVTWTPMIDANGYAKSEAYRAETGRFDAADAPCVAQIAGRDPVCVERAAALLAPCESVAAVELNVGCPQRCARNGGYGAFLLDEPDLLEDLVRALGRGCGTTRCLAAVKVRVYPESLQKTVDLCVRLARAGAQLLTVHGRGRLHRDADPADWEVIRRVKLAVKSQCPGTLVIANGDAKTLRDLRRCASYTNCDGVMAARAFLKDPACFSPPPSVLASSSPAEVRDTQALAVARTYLGHVADVGAPYQSIRRHLADILERPLRRAPHLRKPLSALRGKTPSTAALDRLHHAIDDLQETLSASSYNRTRRFSSTA